MTPTARVQVGIAVAPGVVAGVLVGALARPDLGPLVGYDVSALIYTGWVLLRIWPLDAARTSALALREDPTRPFADLIVLFAAVASLGAIGVVIAQSRGAHGVREGLEVGLSLLSVALSWALVHTVFALKYARLYYRPPGVTSDGGVQFEDHVAPQYTDFLYLSFTIGMTFQVSDTDLQTSEFRALALRHALLAYAFGAVILGATINLVAGLAH